MRTGWYRAQKLLSNNSELFDHMITDFLWLSIEDYELNAKYFQKYDARSSTILTILAEFHEQFPGRVTSEG